MKATVISLSLVAAAALCCGTEANAFPAGAAVGQSASAASPIEKAQYREFRTRHGIVKCYREFVFGSYRCHTY
jgi:hypothetical protein